MFVIAVYDVEAKRCAKMLKLFRQYMVWVQNSVFEGELTESQYKTLQQRASKVMNPLTDSVVFYQLGHEKYVRREALGLEKEEHSRFI
ncbi:MAG TPA: CRISPR-associated endonuclease Cas2 [Rhodothermales bacterium]|nr:CRISPR-associated endonuclease Cas2 [Rhodothermales bacterium]